MGESLQFQTEGFGRPPPEDELTVSEHLKEGWEEGLCGRRLSGRNGEYRRA